MHVQVRTTIEYHPYNHMCEEGDAREYTHDVIIHIG
jgi:hypothetical protein